MWTNRAVQKMIDVYGERINSISLNNGKYILVGYESGIQLSDISLETIEGVDCIKIHHKQQSGGTVLEWDDFVTTEFIEGIDVLDEADQEYRIDPLRFK